MDIIRDILNRVQQSLLDGLGVSDQVADILNCVDREVRHEYGGERAYIAKTSESTVIESAQRNNAIRRAWKNGEPISLLSQRHGLSRRMIYKIVRGES